MWVLKPNWIVHGELKPKPIISVDIDPQCERLATGCMDNSIGIWKLLCILEDNEDEDNDPQLAHLTQHCGQVNAVRWSPSGEFLASASDDALVIVWQMGPCGLSDNLEEWRPWLSLKGHQADVRELIWDHSGKVLVSGGVDNHIMIWNIENKQQYPMHVLDKHIGFISGLAFDPLNKHLFTLAEDLKLIKWCAQTWKFVKEFSIPLDHEIGHTLKKFSITSDGMNIIVPGPKRNTLKYSASVLSLEFEPTKYFVGHLAPVSVIRCSPTLYESDSGLVSLVAVGGYDGAISL